MAPIAAKTQRLALPRQALAHTRSMPKRLSASVDKPLSAPASKKPSIPHLAPSSLLRSSPHGRPDNGLNRLATLRWMRNQGIANMFLRIFKAELSSNIDR
jgi:hypothetical protein